MDQTPNLALPYIISGQAQKHVTHNEAIRALDALVQLTVVTRTLAAPPATPPAGARYIVASPASGAWAGRTNAIAAWQDGGWLLYPATEGLRAWIADEGRLVAFNGSAWVVVGGGVQSQLGVNTTADTTNRLAVASAAALFTHDGAGHQIKINKAAAAATGSLLFQTGFSGRAEFGLTGDDDVHLKVSADGTTWREAIVVDRQTGRVQFPSGGGGVAVRDTSVVVQVPSQVGSIQQAIDAQLAYRFTGAAQGIVEVAAGTYPITAALRVSHPQPARIVVRAATAVVPLAEADIAATRVATEATVRARYGVVVEARSTGGMVLGPGEGVTLQDIAIVQYGAGSWPGIDLVGGASVQLTRCAVVGFAFGVTARQGARVVLDQGSALVHADQHGASLDTASSLRTIGTASLLMRNGQYGARASGNSTVDLALTKAKLNGASGLLLEGQSAGNFAGCDVRDNGANGVQLAHHATAVIQGSTLGPNGAKAVSAAYGSTVSASAITVGGAGAQLMLSATAASLIVSAGPHIGAPVFDPAVGTTGNSGSWTV